jgi:hypothetical protein
VPDAAAPLDLRADLRTRRVLTSVTLDAPKETRALPRISWLLRQLKDAPGDLRVEVAFSGSRETTSLLLADAREEPRRLLSPTDPRREPRAFVLEMSRPLGTKRGKGKGSRGRHPSAGRLVLSRPRPATGRLASPGASAARRAAARAGDGPPASEDPPPSAEAGRDPGEALDPPA